MKPWNNLLISLSSSIVVSVWKRPPWSTRIDLFTITNKGRCLNISQNIPTVSSSYLSYTSCWKPYAQQIAKSSWLPRFKDTYLDSKRRNKNTGLSITDELRYHGMIIWDDGMNDRRESVSCIAAGTDYSSFIQYDGSALTLETRCTTQVIYT